MLLWAVISKDKFCTKERIYEWHGLGTFNIGEKDYLKFVTN